MSKFFLAENFFYDTRKKYRSIPSVIYGLAEKDEIALREFSGFDRQHVVAGSLALHPPSYNIVLLLLPDTSWLRSDLKSKEKRAEGTRTFSPQIFWSG